MLLEAAAGLRAQLPVTVRGAAAWQAPRPGPEKESAKVRAEKETAAV